MTGPRPRILMLGDSLALGGTEGQFVEIVRGLDRSRWDVDVSCLRAEGPLRAKLDAAGVRAWSCGCGSFRSPRVLLAAWGLARQLRAHRVRLVHAFDFYSNILGVLAARAARVPVVIASQRDLGDLRPAFQQRLHRWVLARADHVLVNSEAVAARVRASRPRETQRIVMIPNGVDVARFRPGSTEQRSSPPVIVGTLANLRPEKGILDFVRAAALVREQCPEARFVVWGDGPLRADVERLAEGLGLRGAFELRGRTTEPEVALREVDVFVLASVSEACSNVLLEAMATGPAVVATRVGGNPYLVDDEVTGLLAPPGDPAGLAKAIVRLIEERSLAARLSARALARVRAEFSIDQMLGRVQAFYERALTGSTA